MRSNITTSAVMRDVLIAMVPAALMSVWVFGLRAALLIAVCVISCVVLEFLYNKAMGKSLSIGDLSAAVTGVLLAFNLPVTLPLWIAVVGCAAAIIVAKCMFGGIGANFANPAILGRVVLLVSFAQPMTNWVLPKMVEGSAFQVAELVSGATPLALIKEGAISDWASIGRLAIGTVGGSLGETSAIALTLGFIYLVVRKIITPTTPLVFIGTVGVLALVFGQNPLLHMLSGGVFLGAIFMATDYATSPMTEKGKVIFGIGCGLITMIIRLFGSYPEGVSFAILVMNLLTPHIDTLTKSKPFGGVKK